MLSFWSKVDKRGPMHPSLKTRCWVWVAGRYNTGYGSFCMNGRTMGAHRAAMIIEYGAVPAGQHVLHHCDRRECVRPDHLFFGTHSDNMRDASKKKRLALQQPGLIQRQRGAEHHNAKLTERKVRHIRALADAGWSQRRIAAQFGITQPSVGYIVRREQWGHV